MRYRFLGRTGLKVSELCLGATGWALQPEQMDRLNQAREPLRPYPYSFVSGLQRQ